MKKTLLLCLALLTAPVFGAGAFELDKFLTDMENAEKNITSVMFDYNQEINFTLTKEKQLNSGQAVFLKPSGVSITQTKPIKQTIISDGTKVWIYTPEYGQVIQDNWKKWTKNSLVPDSLVNMGQNWKDMRKKYTFTYIGSEDAGTVLTLTPKVKDLWKIKLWIDPKTFVVNRMTLTAENVAITTYAYNYQLNKPLDKNMFKFKPPKGAEVMKMP
jgi:outer membrane lipoprotein carrier protein